MPTPPYAKLRVALDGGAAASGIIIAPGGNVCQLSADPAGTGGVYAYKYEIWEYPAGFATPAGWTLDGTSGVLSYTAGPTPPTVTLPAASLWGKWFLRFTVNNGDPGANPSIPATQLVDQSTVIKIAHPSGYEDIGFLESNQFDAQRQWVAALKNNLRLSALGIVPGADLTDADQTLVVANGNKRTQRAATLTANRNKTLGTAGATTGEMFEIVRLDTSVRTIAVINGGPGAGTLYTFPASQARAADFKFDGTNWALGSHAAIA
jgi:hypothetical protein